MQTSCSRHKAPALLWSENCPFGGDARLHLRQCERAVLRAAGMRRGGAAAHRAAALRGRRPGLAGKRLPAASGSGSRARLRPSRGAGALRSPLHAQAMALPARLSYYVCHTFPFSNVILCGSGKGSVLRHARGTSAKRQPVWRRRCRSSTGGGTKAGAVCARQQAKSGRPPSRPVRGGGLRAYRPRFLFCAAFRHRRSQNHTFCKQPATMATGDRAGSTAYTRNVRNPCTASRRKTG